MGGVVRSPRSDSFFRRRQYRSATEDAANCKFNAFAICHGCFVAPSLAAVKIILPGGASQEIRNDLHDGWQHLSRQSFRGEAAMARRRARLDHAGAARSSCCDLCRSRFDLRQRSAGRGTLRWSLTLEDRAVGGRVKPTTLGRRAR